MSDQGEQHGREFTRVSIHVQEEVKVDGKVIKTDETRDLSLKGVFVSCNQALPSGTDCEVSLKLVGSELPIEIDIKGKVGRSSESGMAVEFTEIDLESYDHLQNLVKYNAHNEDQVEQEIKDHLGLKRR